MVAHFRHFPAGAEQNPAASFQWGNSAETGLYFQAESHFHVERQNRLSGAQCNLSAVYQSWEQIKATKTQMLKTVKQPEHRVRSLLLL